MSFDIIRGNALALPLADDTVDLVVTSPPYFGLRSYQDDGQHYTGQLGSEATPAEFVDALLAATAEMVRVLKPSGSIFVNLGDKYAGSGGYKPDSPSNAGSNKHNTMTTYRKDGRIPDGTQAKSLMGIPWRYALRCIDDLGLILRAEIIWSKPNGLPESVTDRVRRSHEVWFHFTVRPRYYSAVDEIREEHAGGGVGVSTAERKAAGWAPNRGAATGTQPMMTFAGNPLGKLPGSVWTVPTQPLTVPAHLGVDHFACVDVETEILTRRGWLRYDEVTEGDEAAGLDLDSGVTWWTTVHGIHRYDYDGDLVAVDARGLSMRLTPNHRTLAHRHTGRHRLRESLRVIRADDLTGQHAIPRAVAWADDNREKAVGVRVAALMGWVAAEGWYQGRSVYLSQSATANPQHVAAIDALLPEPVWRRESQRTWRERPWTDVSWRVDGTTAAAIRALMPDKLLPMLDLPSVEAEALLEAFVAGDGHVRPDGRRAIFQKDRRNLDVLQVYAVRLGYNSTLRQSGGRWVLYLNPPRPARLRRGDGTSLVRREHYVGTVWCVTTGTGTFVARRNGAVFVTGNSFPMEWPRRIIRGWSPPGVCSGCGEGRRPVVATSDAYRAHRATVGDWNSDCYVPGEGYAENVWRVNSSAATFPDADRRITGYACACVCICAALPHDPIHAPACPANYDAPTTPAVVLDPFGGTGTTALVAHALGRHGISVDMSADYCRLAEWRCNDRGQLAAAMQVDKPAAVPEGQLDMFGGVA